MQRPLLLLATATLLASSNIRAQCVSPTTILGTDVVAASRSVINANFTNLSDCKAPKASPTFTGTVTITGLGTGALKATSGAIGLVTGSAGNCVHVDGSSAACTTGSVVSVAMTGDNVIYGTSVTGSPVTNTGTLVPVLKTQTANTVLAGPSSAGPTAPTFRALVAADIPTIPASGVSGIPHPFGASFDGGGSAITVNSVTYLHLPYACTIQAWNIAVDTGTVTAKVWKVASGTAIPTSGNSINTSGIAISSNTNVRSTTLSDFTTVAVAAHDIAAVTLTAVSGATKAIVTVECQ